MENRAGFDLKSILFIGVIIVSLAVLVSAVDPTFNEAAYNVTHYFVEDSSYYYNFTSNITGTATYFSILDISLVGGSYGSAHSGYPWFMWNDTGFSNSTLGVLRINSTYNNQSGNFTLNAHAQGVSTGHSAYFYFVINATNDAPNFTLASSYSKAVGQSANTTYPITLTGSDEELQYPLIYSVNFSSCNPASWSSRVASGNCTLTNSITNSSNVTSVLNFTNIAYDDSGVYNLTVCVNDTLEGAVTPSFVDSTYNQNKTMCYNTTFTVQASLTVNVSDCSNKVLNESEEFTCWVNVTSLGSTDRLNATSVARLRDSTGAGSFNSSWFFAGNLTNATDFTQVYFINVTPLKTEIGNWTINFTVDDLDDAIAAVTQPIYVYVNRTTNDVPSLSFIANLTTSTDALTTINFNATDDDLRIPDKVAGYNENLTFTRNITNSSGQEVNSLFSVTKISTSGNISYARIQFTPVSGQGGNYTINITVNDSENAIDSQIFNITILDNAAPVWNVSSNYSFNWTVNSTVATTVDNLTNYNFTSGGYVYDGNGDTITYSNYSSAPPSFNMSSAGIVNFIPWKKDVGYWSFNITADDGYLSANQTFIFNISNVNSVPTISSLKNSTNSSIPGNELSAGGTIYGIEDSNLYLKLDVYDNDFWINTAQISGHGAYDESLTVYANVTNLTTVDTVLSINFSVNTAPRVLGDNNNTIYEVNFIPLVANVGNYSVNVSITDANSSVVSRQFYLNITAVGDAPILNASSISNKTKTIYDSLWMDVNATDEEDGSDNIYGNGSLTFKIENLTAGGNFLNTANFNSTTGVLNLTNLANYAGIWEYNISVNDTDGLIDWTLWKLTVYGVPTLVSPTEGDTFNLTENTLSALNFTLNHSVANNLSVRFLVDTITCAYQNASNCTYGDFSLRDTISGYGNGTNISSWSFTPNYTDETYGNLKNLTLMVYPIDSALNSTQINSLKTNFSFSLNISHTNYPVTVISNIPNPYPSGTYGASTPITFGMASYFYDVDYTDTYYLQNVTFNVTTSASSSVIRAEVYDVAYRLPWNGNVSGWSLQMYGEEEGSENITIQANDSSSTASNGPFQVTFAAPSTTTVTAPSSGGGGGSNQVKHYSLKIVLPGEIVITPEKNQIKIPFSIQNNGQLDLEGIDLTSYVQFNNEFSSDVKISLGENHLDELKFGQSENFTMVISANTQKSGRYKATIFANVTSPKFTDWGDFYIELRKTNETEAEQLLLFTEKLLAENPQCLELMELLNEAEDYFNKGNYGQAYSLSQQAVEACEESIASNEQVRFSSETVRDSFYYVSFATLVIFFAGFIFYIYKRVKFNKAKVDEYI